MRRGQKLVRSLKPKIKKPKTGTVAKLRKPRPLRRSTKIKI